MYLGIEIDTALLLFGAIIYGIVTTYYDVKYRKVPNKITTIAIAYAIIVNALIIGAIALNGGKINIKYITDQTLNTLFATTIGIIFYYMDFAGPADGKMLIAYSLLLPVSIYHKGYFWPYPGIVHLAATYVLAYIYVIGKGLRRIGVRKTAERTIKDIFSKQTIVMFAYIIALTSIIQIIGNAVNVKLSPVLALIYVLLIYYLIKRNEKVVRWLIYAGMIAFAIKVIREPTKVLLETLPKYFLLTVMLRAIFSPIRISIMATKEESIPLAVFLFIGALVTVVLVL